MDHSVSRPTPLPCSPPRAASGAAVLDIDALRAQRQASTLYAVLGVLVKALFFAGPVVAAASYPAPYALLVPCCTTVTAYVLWCVRYTWASAQIAHL